MKRCTIMLLCYVVLATAAPPNATPAMFGFTIGMPESQVYSILSNAVVRYETVVGCKTSESRVDKSISFPLSAIKPGTVFDDVKGIQYRELGAVQVKTANGSYANVLGAVEKNTKTPARISLGMEKGKLMWIRLSVGGIDGSGSGCVWDFLEKIGKNSIASDKHVALFNIHRQLECAVQETSSKFEVGESFHTIYNLTIIFYNPQSRSPDDFFESLGERSPK